MSNKHASKQHGLHDIKRLQPCSKNSKKKNKAMANARKEERRAIISA